LLHFIRFFSKREPHLGAVSGEKTIVLEKTTIRLSQEDKELIARLGRLLGYRLGKAEEMNQSEVIRYCLRRMADLELDSALEGENRSKMSTIGRKEEGV
jgi:hypothetical protein